ncbi:MAG TPA: HPr kinase/phosphatase C-terminal domain-containing protein [Rhodoblastus sp.]|nr:HPr kinase/phosphatase C-terminal domain-containing protein [Rhodoblastus sp.]
MTKPPFRINANAVALGEKGVLIRGRSAAGKSSLALALVDAWRRRGDFARLVADDCVLAHICGGRAVLSPHPAISGLVEWRGIGLLPQDYEEKAVLALIVDLESDSARADSPRLPEPEELSCDFHGLVKVPILRLPERQTERSVAAIVAFLHKVSTK